MGSKVPSASESAALTVVVQNAGSTGLAAIKSLVSKSNINVRTASRNPEKLIEKVKDLKGVKVYKTGDDAVFEGADRFICIPPGGTPDPDDRVAVAVDFLRKAKSAGIKHGVVLSCVVAEGRRGLFGRQFGDVEDTATSLKGVKIVKVRAPMFFENMWGDVASIQSHDTFYAPVDGDVHQLTCAVADVGNALANAALDTGFGGKTVHVIGDNLSKNEIAKLYSKKLDRTVTFSRASVDAATEAFKAYGMPLWQIKGAIELFGNNETNAFVATHRGEFEALVGRKPQTAEEYIDSALIHGLAKKTES